jgi:hypothetical protein
MAASSRYGCGHRRSYARTSNGAQTCDQPTYIPEAIANYAGMNPVDQEHARQLLRERVRWRLRDRKRRASIS